jgi:hypothetical protein
VVNPNQKSSRNYNSKITEAKLSHRLENKVKTTINRLGHAERMPEERHVKEMYKWKLIASRPDRLFGLVVRVLGYRSGGSGSIPGTTRKSSSGSGTGSTQPCEYN